MNNDKSYFLLVLPFKFLRFSLNEKTDRSTDWGDAHHKWGSTAKRLSNNPYFIHHLTVDWGRIYKHEALEILFTHIQYTIHRLTGENSIFIMPMRSLQASNCCFSKRMMDVDDFLKVRYSSVVNVNIYRRERKTKWRLTEWWTKFFPNENRHLA